MADILDKLRHYCEGDGCTESDPCPVCQACAEIERLRDKCDQQAMIIRRLYPENFPDTWFVASEHGEKDKNGLPKYIDVCPAFGVGWTQVYEKTDRTISTEGS